MLHTVPVRVMQSVRMNHHLVEVTKQDDIYGLREIGQKLFRLKLWAAPRRVCGPDALPFDLYHLDVRDGIAYLRRVRVAVNDHGPLGTVSQPLHHAGTHKVSAMNSYVRL